MMNKKYITSAVVLVIIAVIAGLFHNNSIREYKEEITKYQLELKSSDSTAVSLKDSVANMTEIYRESMGSMHIAEVESVVVIKWRENGTVESKEIRLNRVQKDTLFMTRTDTIIKEVRVAVVESTTTSITEHNETIETKKVEEKITPSNHIFKVGANINTTYDFKIEPMATAGYYRKFSILYAGAEVRYTPIQPANTEVGLEMGVMF
jgi:hypothetical protein